MEKNLQELLSMTSLPNSVPYRDEYVDEDGLIRCRECHTRRRNDDNIVIRCSCQRDSYSEDILMEFRKAQELSRRAQLLNNLRKDSLLGERYKNCSFGTTEIVSPEFEKVLRRCEKYCNIADEVLSKGYGLYIYSGTCGTGKTHLTACMCNELLNQYQQCMFTNITDMTKKIMSTFSGKGDTDEVIRKYVDVDFLFIDDIGIEVVKKDDGNNWLQRQIYEIINLRYNNLKPTIFTSNYSPAELIKERGLWQRTVDRIAEMSSAIIKLEGESYRLKSRKSKAAPF